MIYRLGGRHHRSTYQINRRIAPMLMAAVVAACTLNAAPVPPPTFDKDVQPVLVQVCNNCHNPQLNSGNLNITPYFQSSSITSNRDGWAKILTKLKAGEMPPPGIPGPSPEAMATSSLSFSPNSRKPIRTRSPIPAAPWLIASIATNIPTQSATCWASISVPLKSSPPTIPATASTTSAMSLTVSPTLMQKYLSAAEQIAARAVGGDPLPKPGFVNRHDRVRKVGDSTIELKDAVDYDAEYIVKVNLTGHRGATDKPVLLRISVDGKPIKEVEVPVQISAVNRQGGATQRGVEEGKVFLTANEHTFRAEFVNDEFVKPLNAQARANNNTNIYPETIEIGGPYPPTETNVSAKKVLICDPATGTVCVDRILTTFAHHAYRRPATKTEIAGSHGNVR